MSDPSWIESLIGPIITGTYGDNGMSRALVACLSEKLAMYSERDRQHMVTQTCWNWFSGGTTAASVAAKIEEALTKTKREELTKG